MMDDVSISFEDVSSIDLFNHIIEASIIAISDDGFALSLEFIKVVDNL